MGNGIMSVIIESQLGDPIVIISDFVACKLGVEFDWAKAREFKVGDVVFFVDYYKDTEQRQDYISWVIVFRDESGKLYAAIQNYFVPMDTWKGISEYFQRKVSEP